MRLLSGSPKIWTHIWIIIISKRLDTVWITATPKKWRDYFPTDSDLLKESHHSLAIVKPWKKMCGTQVPPKNGYHTISYGHHNVFVGFQAKWLLCRWYLKKTSHFSTRNLVRDTVCDSISWPEIYTVRLWCKSCILQFPSFFQGTIECTPNSVPMVFIVFNLGILGDYNP